MPPAGTFYHPVAATRASKKSTAPETFSAEERAAMKERAREAKAERTRAEGEQDILDKIAGMPEADRVLARTIHDIVTTVAPELTPKTWYGMPAYARDGAILVFFQPAAKFKTRYSTLGFNDVANLDAGRMWPTAYALTTLTKADEKTIAELVKRAVG
jgi:uncharacterized protein YdhG (YjbR/CyaY superfamily)